MAHTFKIKELLKVSTSALHTINSFQSPKAQMEKSLQFSLCMLSAVVETLRQAPIKVGQIKVETCKIYPVDFLKMYTET